MKNLLKLAIIASFSAFALFSSGCVIESDDACECVYEDGPTCLGSINLATGCSDDCNWDSIIDCDADCYNDGYTGGTCEYDSYNDGYCDCYNKK